MAKPALQIQNVSYSYGKRLALQDLNIELEAGKTLGLLGPNGGGKTTCFRLLSTLMPLQEGRVTILGLNAAKAEKEVRRQIGVVFQSPSLDDKLTVFENLKHQGHLYGLLGASLKGKIESLLKRLGVGDRAKDMVADLSGGLKRRVEIAKCLLHDPKLLLLDEPSTGLDPVARLEMWKCLEGLRKEAGVTILVTTHLMEEAEGLDKIVILDKGKLIAEGTPQELKGNIGKKVLVIEGASSWLLVERLCSINTLKWIWTVLWTGQRVDRCRLKECSP